MGNALIYTATHDVTGEQYQGTATEVAKILGVAATTIYKVQVEGRKVHGHWIIKKEGQQCGAKPGWKLPQSMLDEWDALTSPVRRKEKA